MTVIVSPHTRTTDHAGHDRAVTTNDAAQVSATPYGRPAKRVARGPLLPVADAAVTVPLTDGRDVSYANLDGAASACALGAVADRVAAVLPYYASVHRGAGYLSQACTTAYEQARERIGAFVGARAGAEPADAVVITRNTTDSINLLAGAVPGAVLVLDVEHHANLLPWRESTILTAADTIAATLRLLADELVRRPYALVATTGASNVTGEALPIADVVAIAHAAGARVFVDGAQLVPHRGISLARTGVDYVALSGHKLYAPFGAGALIGRADWLDAAKPYLVGGGATHAVSTDDVTWHTGPARHEGGSPNVLGAIALATACDTLAELPAGASELHEAALRHRLLDGLAAIPGVRIARLWRDSTDPVGVVTFGLDGVRPGLLAAYLSAEHGIGVRDGKFCAHPLTARLGFADGAVRASIGVGTTSEHVDRLVDAVASFVSDGPRERYVLSETGWQVFGDPRPAPRLP